MDDARSAALQKRLTFLFLEKKAYVSTWQSLTKKTGDIQHLEGPTELIGQSASGANAGFDLTIYVAHYRHPLPEHVFDIYMQRWQNVAFTLKGGDRERSQ